MHTIIHVTNVGRRQQMYEESAVINIRYGNDTNSYCDWNSNSKGA